MTKILQEIGIPLKELLVVEKDDHRFEVVTFPEGFVAPDFQLIQRDNIQQMLEEEFDV